MPPTADSSPSRRVTGLIGLAGALLFFTGDMLFYGAPGSGAEFALVLRQTVHTDSVERLFVGGLVGPIAACLCIVGFWHVYLNLRTHNRVLAIVAAASFAVSMVAGSAVHTLWAARGLAMKLCADPSVACRQVIGAIHIYWDIAYYLAATPGFFGAVVLAVAMLWGKSSYPRWMIVFNPAVLLLTLPYAAVLVPAPLGAPLTGGATNLSIALFFAMSVLSTWRASPAK